MWTAARPLWFSPPNPNPGAQRPPQRVVLVHVSRCDQLLSIFGVLVFVSGCYCLSVHITVMVQCSSTSRLFIILSTTVFCRCLAVARTACCLLSGLHGGCSHIVIVSPHVTVVHIGDEVKDWRSTSPWVWAEFLLHVLEIAEVVCYHLHGSSVTQQCHRSYSCCVYLQVLLHRRWSFNLQLPPSLIWSAENKRCGVLSAVSTSSQHCLLVRCPNLVYLGDDEAFWMLNHFLTLMVSQISSTAESETLPFIIPLTGCEVHV